MPRMKITCIKRQKKENLASLPSQVQCWSIALTSFSDHFQIPVGINGGCKIVLPYFLLTFYLSVIKNLEKGNDFWLWNSPSDKAMSELTEWNQNLGQTLIFSLCSILFQWNFLPVFFSHPCIIVLFWAAIAKL